MNLSWLDERDTWKLVLVMMMTMLMAAEIGFRAGRRRHPKTAETGRGHFGAVQASLLGLLALLLGFTFNMSNTRYEARRQLVIEDANVIAALDLRGRYLPEPRRGEFKRLLRQYLELHAGPPGLKHGITAGELGQWIARAEMLHREMSDLVQSEIQGEHPSKGVEGMVILLSDALSIQRKRMSAYENRVPDAIIVLLFGAGIAAASVVGYSGGLGKHRGILAAAMLTLFVSGTVYVILDLDQPRRGIMQIDLTPLHRLRQQMDRDAQPGS